MSLDTLTLARSWRDEGRAVALATVVATSGSSPRPLGSSMTITMDGAFAGSVSGGCIEGAVIEEATALLAAEGVTQPKRVEYGIADEEAWAVGLSCGGTIEVLIERLPTAATPGDWFTPLLEALEQEKDVRSLVITAGPAPDEAWIGGRVLWTENPAEGTENDTPLSRFYPAGESKPESEPSPSQLEAWSQLAPGVHSTDHHTVFFQRFEAPPKLVIVGAVHIAEHLVYFAQRLGFHCIVVDAREAFASQTRFAHAKTVIQGWPSEVLADLPIRSSTYCAFLTHDPKFDDDAIRLALESRARYVGALGSRRTHEQRRLRLADAGISEMLLDRIDAPIGLDLGGRMPEEIALSIAARLVKVRVQGSVQRVTVAS